MYFHLCSLVLFSFSLDFFIFNLLHWLWFSFDSLLYYHLPCVILHLLFAIIYAPFVFISFLPALEVIEGTTARAQSNDATNNKQVQDNQAGPLIKSQKESGQTDQSKPETDSNKSEKAPAPGEGIVSETNSVESSGDSQVVLRNKHDRTVGDKNLLVSATADATKIGNMQSLVESGDFLESVEVHVPVLQMSGESGSVRGFTL